MTNKLAHVLRKNKTTRIPHNFIFYDTESYQERKGSITKHKLRLGWACYVHIRSSKDKFTTTEKWFKFTDKKQFWDWVMSLVREKTCFYLVAHNQHFDFIILDGINYLKKLGYEIEKWVVDSDIFVMKFRKGSSSIVVMDSLNIFKASIEQLGKVLGKEKKKIDFKRCSEEELSEYCKRDVEILKDMFLNWVRFIKDHDLGCFKYTLAGQALAAYRHKFYKHEIYIHANKDIIKLERESYRGGRSEAFRLGMINERVYYLDVNSLYPYVMKEFEYPTRLIKWGRKLSLKGLKRFLSKFCVIARVKVRTEENVFGIKDERLIFPIGEFWATLCSEELRYALENCEILEIKDYAVYERAKIFEDYVDFFNSLKEKYSREGNAVMRNIAKLLLNSLYGKFGQKNEKWIQSGYIGFEDNYVTKYINLRTGKSGLLYCLGGKQYIKYSDEEEAFDSFVAIASEVTANARMYLWKLMKTAGLENVYYVDTDSIFCNEEGYRNLEHLVDQHRLGYLKLEGVSDQMIIRNVKDYTFAGIEKIKGVKKNSKKLDENRFLTERFYKFRTLLRKGSLDTPISEEYIKELKREYKKGIVTPDGRVLPLVISH